MMKLVNKHIRDDVLREYHLHQNLYGYKTGKSTETAIQNVTTYSESATEHKKIYLGAFLHTDGALDRSSLDVITQPDERHGVNTAICGWIWSIQESKNITITRSGETLRTSMARGCVIITVMQPG
jgi:hypothetical protein